MNQPVELFTEPTSSPSVPGEMIFLENENRGLLLTLLPASGAHDLPSAWVNSDSWPCTSGSFGPESSVFLKVGPGVVDISNPAGGDFIGNISIASPSFLNVLSQFQVQDLKRYSGSFPDSFVYTVRCTNEERVSYLSRDLYVCSVPDTSDIAAFIAGMDSVYCVKWASRPPQLISANDSHPYDPFPGYHVYDTSYPNNTIDVVDAWGLATTRDIRVGVIDSGIDVYAGDFATDRLFGDQGYYAENTKPFHGTVVSGVLGAKTGNHIAISGVADVEIYSKKVREGPGIWYEDFLEDMQELMTVGDVDLLNFSKHFGHELPSYKNACAEFYNSNRLMFSSAGNDVENVGHPGHPIKVPARWSSVVSVGGVRRYGRLHYHNVLGGMDFTALAQYVRAVTSPNDPNGDPLEHFTYMSGGTSLSCPIVTGAAAVLLSFNPYLYNDDIYNILAMSATLDPLIEPGGPLTKEQAFGYGLVQVQAAVDSLTRNIMISGSVQGVDRSELVENTESYISNIPQHFDSMYAVEMYRVEKDIVFSSSFLEAPHAWGRGAVTTGANGHIASAFQMDQKRFCGVSPGSISTYGCTLVSYTYKLRDIWAENEWFWYPINLEYPNNMQWGYATLGKDGIVAVPETNKTEKMDAIISPNPFNARVKMSLYCPEEKMTKVGVFDIRGMRVVELNAGVLPVGRTEFSWDGKDQSGNGCSSGMYFFRAESSSRSVTKSFALVK